MSDAWTPPPSFPSSIPPSFRSRLSVSTDLCVAVFLVLTGTVSIAGNGLVLLVMARKRKELKPHELMTINLAICDFGYSLLGAPCLIISSFSHAWMFGETGCMLYGIQGFVFGIGSMLTTCLISLDRCLKISSLRYGQWIERRHASVAVLMVWFYTLFWASLPAVGFGSYGPEPFGTSCTINWWRMKLSLNDRAYIFLILTLCFCVPTLIIVTSYSAIFYTVYRSRHALASISSTNKTHSSKDLKLTKIAAVVCSSFLIAWTPYAVVSLYSALTAKEEQEMWAVPVGMTVHGMGGGSNETRLSTSLATLSSLLNWTSTGGPVSGTSTPGLQGTTVGDPISRSGLGSALGPSSGANLTQGRQGTRVVSSLPPVLTLIPTMFAKAHCMMNPFIYQIMNREFRADVYHMLGLRRPVRIPSISEGKHNSVSLSHQLSWRVRSTFRMASEKGHVKKERDDLTEEKEGRGRRVLWPGNKRGNRKVKRLSPDLSPLDTQMNLEGERSRERRKKQAKEQEASTSSSVLTCQDGEAP
ncbi:opsin-5-like [Alosa sapidissima]|uniref:opsin-5-like n=1 Tax=Alosa sapidissima TaxID=34773 RepID=UPI001C0A300F|nr:opsin-5-like [Alosa sapidissima]